MYFLARLFKIRPRRMAQKARKITRWAVIAFILWLVYAVVSSYYEIKLQWPITVDPIEVEIISPLPDVTPTPTPKPTATPGAVLKIVKEVKAAEPVEPEKRELRGEASYYSRAGCLGCSENLTMANGQTLDDTALTLALTPEMVSRHKLLNDIITVENVKTGKTVKARVTDTGGFGRLGRVADLSVATRDAIECSSLCEVLITY